MPSAEWPLRVLLAVRPGYFRNSLMAWLRIVPAIDVELWEDRWQNARHPDILIFDSDFPMDSAGDDLREFREQQGMRVIALVDPIRKPDILPDVDCLLPKSVSAGEFLMAVRHLGFQPKPEKEQAEYAVAYR